jgi:hypothetical protein
MPNESVRLSQAVGTAIDLMHDEEAVDQFEAHARWSLREVMKRVKPSDCTATEVMALLAVLAPVHSRLLGGVAPVSSPVLTLIRDTAADFGQQVVGGDDVQPH